MGKINPRSIGFRLITGGCLAVILPLMVVGYIAVTKSTDALEEAAKNNALGQATRLATIVESNLSLQARIAAAIATDVDIIAVNTLVKENGLDGATEDIARLRSEMKSKYKTLGGDYNGIFVSDDQGHLVTGAQNNGGDYKGVNIADRDYFNQAKSTGKPAISEIVRSKATDELILVACAPITAANGDFLGIVGLSIKGSMLVDLVSRVKVGETGYAFMINSKGIVNAHPNEKLILSLDLTTLEGMEAISRNMIAGQLGVEEYVFKGVSKIAGHAPVPLKGWSIGLTQNHEEFTASPRATRNIILVVSLIAVAVVSGLVFFASRGITGPINNAVAGLKDIAEGEGDLTMRLKVDSKDEVGEMAKWFNTFIDKLQGIIQQIAENASTVGTSSTQLSQISQNLLLNAEDTSQRSNNVATAAEEMSANLNNVAAAMEQSSTNANMVASAAEEMSTTINEIAENAEKARNVSSEAVQQAQNASSKMGELGQAADKIGKVTEAITEISEQTNLLALNATIEAARAGEAGKGFAVVANEIKELAKQTAAATLDIKTLIDDVQRTTQTTGSEIGEISAVISGVNDIVSTIAAAVEEQTAATREIANNISQASQGIQEVNENVSQSSGVAIEISQNIAEVSIASDKISDSSNEVKDSANDLLARAKDLNQIVGRFKV
ncbi:MAG: methyl-accepting chemotaxis protein [Desulforhopalus sp.]